MQTLPLSINDMFVRWTLLIKPGESTVSPLKITLLPHAAVCWYGSSYFCFSCQAAQVVAAMVLWYYMILILDPFGLGAGTSPISQMLGRWVPRRFFRALLSCAIDIPCQVLIFPLQNLPLLSFFMRMERFVKGLQLWVHRRVWAHLHRLSEACTSKKQHFISPYTEKHWLHCAFLESQLDLTVGRRWASIFLHKWLIDWLMDVYSRFRLQHRPHRGLRGVGVCVVLLLGLNPVASCSWWASASALSCHFHHLFTNIPISDLSLSILSVTIRMNITWLFPLCCPP